MLNNTADQLCSLLTSLVPVKVSWFGILPLQTIAMSLVIAWRFFQHYDFVWLTNSTQVDGFIAKSGCGELHFALLDLGIQEFRFGPRFVRRTISTNGFHIPPRVSARFDWFHLAQNNNCSCIFSAFIIRLIRFRGVSFESKTTAALVLASSQRWNLISCILTTLQDSDGFKFFVPLMF